MLSFCSVVRITIILLTICKDVRRQSYCWDAVCRFQVSQRTSGILRSTRCCLTRRPSWTEIRWIFELSFPNISGKQIRYSVGCQTVCGLTAFQICGFCPETSDLVVCLLLMSLRLSFLVRSLRISLLGFTFLSFVKFVFGFSADRRTSAFSMLTSLLVGYISFFQSLCWFHLAHRISRVWFWITEFINIVCSPDHAAFEILKCYLFVSSSCRRSWASFVRASLSLLLIRKFVAWISGRTIRPHQSKTTLLHDKLRRFVFFEVWCVASDADLERSVTIFGVPFFDEEE